MGDGDADIVRNIVLAWLSEKSIISTNLKRKIEMANTPRENDKQTR